MKLGVYFQYAQNLSVSLRYDKVKFTANAGECLAKLYNLILRQMLVYWNAPFADFIENVKSLVQSDIEAVEKISAEDERKKIINFICQNKILQSEEVNAAQIFAESAKIFTRFEGDRIFGDILEKNLVFVAEGKLSRSLDTGDGWFNALDIIFEIAMRQNPALYKSVLQHVTNQMEKYQILWLQS